MSSLSRIFGWTPSKSEEHVDTLSRPTPPHPSSLRRIFTFQSSHLNKPDNEAGSPTSSISSLFPDGGPQPDSEPLRRGDPEWVARPRNPFIIFRCEYSREHSKEGKRVRRPAGSLAEKTLSKRAAEAWHQLSAEDKNKFKEMAEREREEHARLHPTYRFRPVKRITGKKRPAQAPKLQPQPSNSPHSADHTIAPVPRYPPLPDTPEPPSPLVPHYVPPVQNMSMVKANRRRSASVPSLPVMQSPFTGFSDTEFPRLKPKRSRSLMANLTLPMQADQDSLSFNPRFFEPFDFARGFYLPDDSLSSEIASLDLPFEDQFPDFGTSGPLSPLSAVASSLAGWNGERDIIGNQLAPACSTWPSSPAVDIDGDPLQEYTAYQMSTDAGLTISAGNYATNDLLMNSSSYFPAMANATSATEDAGILYAPMTPYDEAERAYALREYGLGLNTHVGDMLTGDEEGHALALVERPGP